MSFVPALILALMAPVVHMPTKFWQITPRPCDSGVPDRVQDRAALFIHGLIPRPVQVNKAAVPAAHSWQKPDSLMVKRLGADFDLYGFSYAQTLPVDFVAHSRGLAQAVRALKAAGYREIVLIGHSAGGIIAYQFAERYPNAGMTRVVVVAAPLEGSNLARIPTVGLASTQLPFIKSLAPTYRRTQCEACDRPIPPELEIGCVICKMPRLASDTIVPITSQWPDPTQKQGIPAILVEVNHFDAVRSQRGVDAVAQLVYGKMIRWSPAQVDQARRVLFGTK